MTKKLRGIIFDFDGLIFDTETPHYEAWKACYEAHGLPLHVETYSQCVGTDHVAYDPARELERLLERELDWDKLDHERARKVMDTLEGNLRPLPGVENLLEAADQAGLPCAIASSSERTWVEPWTKRLGIRDWFQHIVTVDDVERPKPSPELFLTAAQCLGLEPEEVVVLEDSWNGLQAAHAAGMKCVVVPNRITKHYEFEGAAAQLGSLMEAELHVLDALLHADS